MRIVSISDPHCGHRAGLTPPEWQDAITEGSHTQRNKFAVLQREGWKYYAKIIDSIKPVDVLIVGGDAIDGTGSRSGGTELITTDRNDQIDMAAQCIEYVGAKKIIMVYGTAYHVGEDEDWELVLSNQVKAAKIGSHEWLNAHGVIFDVKHHVGASSVPYGRHTAVAKEHLWNQLWSEHGEQPKANVLLRGHVHYHTYCGGPGWLAMTMPALQGTGTKFGARRCSGTVDFGLVHFDVTKGGSFSWTAHIAKLQSQQAKTLSL